MEPHRQSEQSDTIALEDVMVSIKSYKVYGPSRRLGSFIDGQFVREAPGVYPAHYWLKYWWNVMEDAV